MHRSDLTSLAAISEAHFTDSYGEAMRRFYDKYNNAGPEFFVNFNPVLGDERDKTILGQQMEFHDKLSQDIDAEQGTPSARDTRTTKHTLYKKPDHGDPVGTYAYPAEYVANHWYDFAYGADMGYLRVLKVKLDPEKTLRLDGMTRQRFIDAMKRLNLEYRVEGDGMRCTRDPEDAIMIYEAIFNEEASSIHHYRINSYGKILFALIQRRYVFKVNKPQEWEPDPDIPDDQPPEEPAFKFEGHLVTSGGGVTLSQQDQAKRLLRAGYEVVLDRAKSPLEATIYPAEPEQCICLTKRSYEVVETFKLPTNIAKDVVPNFESKYRMAMKAGGVVAKALNDQVAEVVTDLFKPPTQLRSLEMLRHYIATEEVVPMYVGDKDPTQDTDGPQFAVTTKKGNLIVVSCRYSPRKWLHDNEAHQRTFDAIDEARIRSGEDRHAIQDNLRSFASHSLDKPRHRELGDRNVIQYVVGIVNSAKTPAFFTTDTEHGIYDLPALTQKALANQGPEKAPFTRITRDYLLEIKRGSKKRKEAAAKQNPGAAAAGSSPAPASTTPEESGGTLANPAP